MIRNQHNPRSQSTLTLLYETQEEGSPSNLLPKSSQTLVFFGCYSAKGAPSSSHQQITSYPPMCGTWNESETAASVVPKALQMMKSKYKGKISLSVYFFSMAF